MLTLLNSGSAAAPANARSGELTYYTLGLGACGFDDGGRDETENIVALSHLLLGPQSNGNPFCGRSITIQYGSRTVTAVCRDKCMGCAANDVDASTKVFKDLTGGTDLGRVQVTWWFND